MIWCTVRIGPVVLVLEKQYLQFKFMWLYEIDCITLW